MCMSKDQNSGGVGSNLIKGSSVFVCLYFRRVVLCVCVFICMKSHYGNRSDGGLLLGKSSVLPSTMRELQNQYEVVGWDNVSTATWNLVKSNSVRRNLCLQEQKLKS